MNTTSILPESIVSARVKGVQGDTVTLGIPGSDYQLKLTAKGAITHDPGKRIKGVIEAEGLRVHPATGGGRFIEPVWGEPRIVAGVVMAKDEDHRRLLVDVAVPMWVALEADQLPDAFAVGDLVNCYVESGTTFTPVETS